MSKNIGVMIIDDSAVVRRTLTQILEEEPHISVVATAADPLLAVNKLKTLVPDVIILDIEMPRMDGLTFLKKLMSQHPLPVIICSSVSEKGSRNALLAMEYGAVDIITKPKLGTKQFIEESKILLGDAVRAAAAAGVKATPPVAYRQVQPKLTADVMLPKVSGPIRLETTEKVVLVGASTGGTEALKDFLEALPVDTPGIVIVQHMPEQFTTAFAKRLDSLCGITVKEAEDNDSVLRGRALIAPGNKHTLLKRSGARYYVQVKEGPLVSRHRPSVDVLFRSASRYAGKNAIAVIMTGMGDDGARGMGEMKETGAYTIAQDEKTSVVFGMPRAAIELGIVDTVMPLEKIALEIIRKVVND
jgi:two-component system chemotaxis response regulator CheB